MNTEDEKVGPVDTGAQQADVAAQAAPKPEVETEQVETEEAEDEGEQEDTGEQATPDESDEGAEAQPPERAPLPRGVQRKINKLTRKAGEAMLRNQELEQELAQYRGAQVQPKPAVAEVPSAEPTLEDCDYDDMKHKRLHYQWMREQERRAEAQATAQATARERAAKLVEQEEAFAATVPDYYEVSRAPAVPINQMMVEVLMENPETAPAIAYYFGKHPAEAASIAQMSPAAAGRAIGRIEASLSAPVTSTTPSRPVTQAPAPVATLKPGAPLRKSLDDLPMDQYVAERNRQLKAKGLR